MAKKINRVVKVRAEVGRAKDGQTGRVVMTLCVSVKVSEGICDITLQ